MTTNCPFLNQIAPQQPMISQAVTVLQVTDNKPTRRRTKKKPVTKKQPSKKQAMNKATKAQSELVTKVTRRSTRKKVCSNISSLSQVE